MNHGKWSEKNIPHNGWTCSDVEDLGEVSDICEMCESQHIRYVHIMTHPSYPEELRVGCVCAGNMEENLAHARKREDFMKSRVGKRKRWLSRKWKISNNGNQYLDVDGFHIVIFEKYGKLTGLVKNTDGSIERYSQKKYDNEKQLKLACFDVMTWYLSKDQVSKNI
jgi:hypothetical protein